MNTSQADDFGDSLDDLIGAPTRPTAKALPAAFKPALERPEYVEGCPKCRGTGFFHGRVGYPCFACQGRGKRVFKTAPADRAKARARAAGKRQEREADKAAWREAHKAECAWLIATADRQRQRQALGQKVWDWPISVAEKFGEYGTLTDGQLAAVQKFMARDQERRADRGMRPNHPVQANRIEEAFATARARAERPGMQGVWLKPLKLRANGQDLTFQAGSIGSQWEGQIFVRAGDAKLGVIKAGAFFPRFECSDPLKAAVIEACEDPAQAARAFGKAWGVCTVCGRTLTDDKSIAAGIGPVCAENFGW